MINEFPILEFDPSKNAVIEPWKVVKNIGIPESVVLCFFNDVITELHNKGVLAKITEIRSEAGILPVYEMNYNGSKVVIVQPGVGAPFATGVMEEIIALGGRKFIACGGAGVLDRSIVVGHVVVPCSAVRDEGTSYHYLEPSREVQLEEKSVNVIIEVLNRHKVSYLKGKTWTTDAFYRETHNRVKRRKEEGCLTVEMECSAFAAVAKFRGVSFAQLLYGGDDVSCEEWDNREWHTRTEIRERLIYLAVEASLKL
jgi:uridine phosphorylase